jgi:hypothetical protein
VEAMVARAFQWMCDAGVCWSRAGKVDAIEVRLSFKTHFT